MLSAIGTRKIGTDEPTASSQKLDPRLTFSVSRDVSERLRRLAHLRGVKISPMIRAWIEESLIREEMRDREGKA